MTTDVRICRRLAPSVRSIPNSRMRWAIVIEKVLKIRKPPTTTATPANTSRATVRNCRSSLMSEDSCAALSSPVRTSTVAGSTSRTRSRTSTGSVPSAASIEIWSSSFRLFATRWASGSVRVMIDAPPKSVSPSLAIPTISYSPSARSPTTPTLSPTSKSPRSAVVGSIAASLVRRRAAPLLVGQDVEGLGGRAS